MLAVCLSQDPRQLGLLMGAADRSMWPKPIVVAAFVVVVAVMLLLLFVVVAVAAAALLHALSCVVFHL